MPAGKNVPSGPKVAALSNGVSLAPVSMTATRSRIVMPGVVAIRVVVAPTAVRTSVLSQVLSIVARRPTSGTLTR